MDEFIGISLSRQTMARYTIRRSIMRALNYCLPWFKGDVLDVGCGKMPYRVYILENSAASSYTGIDLDNAIEYDHVIKPDLLWDGKTLPLDAASFDTVLLTEVLEHVDEPDRLLSEIYRVLRPGGHIFFTVPFLWNLHEAPHDFFRYTPWALEKLFKRNQFEIVLLKPTGGWHASMAQFLGLWVMRSGIQGRRKKLLGKLALYFIPKLLEKDEAEETEFKEGQMITGLFGLVKKT